MGAQLFKIDFARGLKLIDAPTGIGKTHAMVDIAVNFLLDNSSEFEKIIIISPQHKILPYEDILKRLAMRCSIEVQEAAERYKTQLLYLKSIPEHLSEFASKNEDFIDRFINKIEAISRLDVGFKYASKNVIKAFSSAKEELRKSLQKFVIYHQQKAQFNEELSQLACAIFDKTNNLLNFLIPTTKLSKNLLNTINLEFAEIFPQLIVSNAKVVLLSAHKFIMPMRMFLQSSYRMFNSSENCLVFIDEFDKCKESLINALLPDKDSDECFIRSAASVFNALIELENQNCAAELVVRNLKFVEEKRNIASNIARLQEIIRHVKNIKEEFYLWSNYKMHEEVNTCIVEVNRRLEYNRKLELEFDSKLKYTKITSEQVENNLGLNVLLRRIEAALSHLGYFVQNMVNLCTNAERAKGDGSTNSWQIYIEENSIQQSLMNDLRIKKEASLLNLDFPIKHIPTFTKRERIDTSLYALPYRLFVLKNSSEHIHHTAFTYAMSLPISAEEIILRLARKNAVIGLSATARMNTVYKNFNISHLENMLDDKFFSMSDDELSEVKRRILEKESAISKDNIEVEAITQEPTPALLEEFFSKLQAAHEGDYRINYLREFASVIKRFNAHKSSQTLLFINRANPKSPIYDMQNLCSVVEKLGYSMKVLCVNNFNNLASELQEALECCDKVVVVSAYGSIGTGVNLQYPKSLYDERKYGKLLCANEQEQFKDFDEIFLGDLTYSKPTIEENISPKEQFKLCYLMHELYGCARLSTQKLKANKELIINKIKKPPQYDDESDFACGMLADLIQTLGRVCRTSVFAQKTYVYYSQGNLDRSITSINIKNSVPNFKNLPLVSKSCLKHMDEALKHVSKTSTDAIKKNAAAEKNTAGNDLINTILRRDWTQKRVEEWRALRQLLLRYPWISSAQADEIKHALNLYVKHDKPKYFYKHTNDYVEITADFSSSRPSGFCELSSSAARLDVLLKNPVILKLWQEHNYAQDFGPDSGERYLLTPVLFNNIYKGAIGEIAGKALVENELNGIQLVELDDYATYEFFDYEIYYQGQKTGIYVDFKHWLLNKSGNKYFQANEKLIDEKAKSLNARGVVFINLLANMHEFCITQASDKLFIPSLLDEQSAQINKAALQVLVEFIERLI